jgi:hypothetical protein
MTAKVSFLIPYMYEAFLHAPMHLKFWNTHTRKHKLSSLLHTYNRTAVASSHISGR